MRSNTRGLVDVEALILECRTKRAETYIQEAVNCYKSGAYRSCVVATWVAVTYDLIDKLRDLSLHGNSEAKQEIDKFEDIVASGAVSRSQKFENSLLDKARDKFELLASIEYKDLNRLREDRHRCAHPSVLPGGVIYQPTPEVARSHMRNAVGHLLSREPVQGKEAQERIMRDIRSEYFPSEHNEAIRRLKATPLANARESLVNSVVDLILKEALLDTFLDQHNDQQKIYKRAVVLKALPEVASTHPVENITKEKANKIFHRIEDAEIGRFIFICSKISYLWNSIEKKQQRVIDYLNQIRIEPSPQDDTVWLPIQKVHPDLLFALRVDGLRDLALERIQEAGPEALAEAAEKLPEDVEVSELSNLTDQVVKHYAESDSYYTTRDWGKLVIRFIDRFSVEDMKRLLASLRSNDQIYGAILGDESNWKILERSVTMCDELAEELRKLYIFCNENREGLGVMKDRAEYIKENCGSIIEADSNG